MKVKVSAAIFYAIIIFASLSVLTPGSADADNFYKGKTIRFIVGYAPGGGYDTYARLLARHLADALPGHPTVVVQNMSGAGSNRAAGYIYAVAPKDGTAIGPAGQ